MAGTHLYTGVEERHWESKVYCLTIEQNVHGQGLNPDWVMQSQKNEALDPTGS